MLLMGYSGLLDQVSVLSDDNQPHIFDVIHTEMRLQWVQQ